MSQYYSLAHINMIKGQILPIPITDERVIDVFSSIPKHLFLPESLSKIAYCDLPITLAPNRQILPSGLHAKYLETARIQPTDNILDIGCLTGYSTALLAKLGNKVVAIESDTSLASQAHTFLHKLKLRNTIILQNDLALGHPEGGPYQVILMNGAVHEVPKSILEQLDMGGRLLTIIRPTNQMGHITLIEKHMNGFSKRILGESNFPYLPGC